MPSKIPSGQVQINFRAPVWMRDHLTRRAKEQSSPVARSSVTAILYGLIAEDARRNPTGADQAAA